MAIQRAKAWVIRVGTAIVVITAGLVAIQSPASAHTVYQCSSMSMGAVNELRLGGVRQIGNHNHNHDIRWGIGYADCGSNFPSGGSLNVRVRFIKKNSSGGCTNPPVTITDGALQVFTGNQTKTLATDVLPTTCYRIIWRPTTGNLAGRTVHGALIWPQS